MKNNTNHQPKRHCMIVHAHYPLGETRVQRQAEALLDNGIEVDIICLRGSQEEPTGVVNGATVYRLPVARHYGEMSYSQQLMEYLRFFWAAMLALMRLHRQRRYHVVQVHNLPDFLIFAAWYPKLTGAKLILDLHDLMPEFFAARIHKDLNHWIVRLVAGQERISCGFANHVITVTELWRQTLIERGIPAKKVSVVMNVADDRMFFRSTDPTADNKPAGFHVFYHGAIVPRYGLDLLVRAVACLRDQIPNIRLTIHGDSSYRQTLTALAEELGVSDRVKFSYKFLPMGELPNLIRTADIAVVPYRRDVFTDGILPTKLMEYTAVGVPVITARTPAIEAYFDETMVEFFDQENLDDLTAHLLKLYQNRARLKSLVECSDRFNQQHNWARQKANYVALVKSLQG